MDNADCIWWRKDTLAADIADIADMTLQQTDNTNASYHAGSIS